eukprot:TRINITY_DN81533_c0_g1_i1.p1 TRINITY_DN81533_c0_g1~~TRINITY_DN81533_c0_g1_i1.p1  ORF type:complete len:336 (+),score=77.50 TRINITY_DN81533_c0_g1_i1:109-1116(+)
MSSLDGEAGGPTDWKVAVAGVAVLACAFTLLLTSLLGTQAAAQSKKKRRQSVKSQAAQNEDAAAAEATSRWLERLQVSEADVDRIRSHPQRSGTGRASPEWLRHRRHRLTASRFHKAAAAVSAGGYAGDNDEMCMQIIEEMLTQPEAKTSPKRFGITKEPVARQSYIGLRRKGLSDSARAEFRVEETGLCVWREEPWLAASPDGIVFEGDEVGALEIKCCRDAASMWNTDQLKGEFYDQLQGEMAVLSSALQQKVTWCDFFVWSPDHRVCRRVEFDPDYFFGKVLPKLRAFYFERYVPVAKRVNLAASGSDLAKSARKLASKEIKRRKTNSAAMH